MSARQVDPRARRLLREALHEQAAGRLDSAFERACGAVAIDPAFADGHAYLGSTLVQKRRLFADGLAALRLAVSLAPGDAVTLYTAGWCEEYVANTLARPRKQHQAVTQGPGALYAAARAHFLRALAADPDDQLRGDIEDMLDVVAAATGEPWEPGESSDRAGGV